MVRIGMRFEWNGRMWTVYSFNERQVLISSDSIKTGIDHEVFLKMFPEA